MTWGQVKSPVLILLLFVNHLHNWLGGWEVKACLAPGSPACLTLWDVVRDQHGVNGMRGVSRAGRCHKRLVSCPGSETVPSFTCTWRYLNFIGESTIMWKRGDVFKAYFKKRYILTDRFQLGQVGGEKKIMWCRDLSRVQSWIVLEKPVLTVYWVIVDFYSFSRVCIGLTHNLPEGIF